MLFAKPSPRDRRAFTLIELLTVVIIIGILAGLVTAAAIRVRGSVRKAAVVFELKQLEMAFHGYKDRFIEFPPDDLRELNDLNQENWPIIRRHLAKAFPRYRPGVSTRPPYGTGDLAGWDGFQADVDFFWQHPDESSLTIDIRNYRYGDIVTFFLGGMPIWNVDADWSGSLVQRPVTRFDGFSANPANPFERDGSRIGPFYDFDSEQVQWNDGRLQVWPKNIVDRTNGYGAMAYFRAENNRYILRDDPLFIKRWDTAPDGSEREIIARPAVDTRKPNNAVLEGFEWVNPRSFQLFSSGMDMQYGGGATNLLPLQFPDGPYNEETLDDLANFTSGTMEDAMP